MKFFYKLFTILLFFAILLFIKEIAKDLSKNFENFESEKSQKSRKSVRDTEKSSHEEKMDPEEGLQLQVDASEVSEEVSEEGSEDNLEDKLEDKSEGEKLFDEETGVRLLTELEMIAIENRKCCRYFLMSHNK